MTHLPIHKRYYLNPQRDAAILEWLARQPNESEAIRAVLHAHVTGLLSASSNAESHGPGSDLALLRQVVQAAVTEAMAGLTITGATASNPVDAGRFEAVLDEFGDNLLLG
jgi:hypothetical protein